MEKWKKVKIEGFENYRVSNRGRIKNSTTGKIRKVRADRQGYPLVDLKNNGKNKTVRAHRLIASHWLPKRKEHQNEVNHIDGNKLTTDPRKLEWTSHSENMKHAHATGLQGRYVTNGLSIVRAHRRLRKNGASIIRSHKRKRK